MIPYPLLHQSSSVASLQTQIYLGIPSVTYSIVPVIHKTNVSDIWIYYKSRCIMLKSTHDPKHDNQKNTDLVFTIDVDIKIDSENWETTWNLAISPSTRFWAWRTGMLQFSTHMLMSSCLLLLSKHSYAHLKYAFCKSPISKFQIKLV